jgi:EAL domain-containing protein (putative c-di-GMP-specific phosphodiesterase class I)/CheY-like chemotaxis protein
MPAKWLAKCANAASVPCHLPRRSTIADEHARWVVLSCDWMGKAVEPRVENESTVLVVDDDSEVLAVMQRALMAVGLKVVPASTGADALAQLKNQAFDAMVSDIQMPGITGLKLLRAVREHDLDLPVVLITGNPDLKGAAAAVEYGAFQYMIKPVSIERLRAVVQRALDVGRIARLKRQCAEQFGSSSFYVGDRAGVESKFNQALRSLWMAYQPIVRASDGSAFAYEALLRSEEPALPHPGAVLKAAERLRRINDVGRAVRDLVALDAERESEGGALFFINLHPEDLLDPALYLPNARLSRVARHVVLELTDRASLETVSDASERIERLRAIGFRIAIDDLGAGPAGSGTFTQLEPEFVKLDISLVRGIHHDSDKRKIVQSMVRLCHNMGKSIIAEGVEHYDEQRVLVEVGCDFLQGYLFGRPARFHEMQRGVENSVA